MKRIVLISSIIFTSFAGSVCAQDIAQSQVPSPVLKSFQLKFPQAMDVEWEMKGNLYNVDFETGALGTDHEAWYEKSGKLVKHTEEISAASLPKQVSSKVNSDYGKYRIKDVKKITEGQKITYTMELKSSKEEWKVAYDSQGRQLSKIAD